MTQPDAYRALVDELMADPQVSEGQMMGMPALKVGSKMFGGWYDDQLVVRIGRERAEALIAEGRAQPSTPRAAGAR